MSWEKRAVEEKIELDVHAEKAESANEDAYAEETDYREHDAEHDSQIFIKVIGASILLVFLGFFFTFVANPTVIPERVATKKQTTAQKKAEDLHLEVYEQTHKGYSIIKPRVPVNQE